MKGMINKLYSEINALISESKGTRSNSLRYSVGSKIMAFYVNHKEELKVTDKEFEEELKVFYENLGIDTARLKTEKFIRQSAWDKIKIAISDALSKQDSSDGYSLTNLGYMQQFYRKFRNSPDGLEKALKLDWSHNVELLKDKLNEDERKFYLKKAISESWSVKELEKQVREDSYDDFLEILDSETKFKYQIKDFNQRYRKFIDKTNH